MNLSEKINLNKEIREYDGDNSFILSLKKELRTNKYLKKEKDGNRNVRVLSDRQYDVFESMLK